MVSLSLNSLRQIEQSPFNVESMLLEQDSLARLSPIGTILGSSQQHMQQLQKALKMGNTRQYSPTLIATIVKTKHTSPENLIICPANSPNSVPSSTQVVSSCQIICPHTNMHVKKIISNNNIAITRPSICASLILKRPLARMQTVPRVGANKNKATTSRRLLCFSQHSVIAEGSALSSGGIAMGYMYAQIDAAMIGMKQATYIHSKSIIPGL